jgi:hypothetical protein
VTETPCPHHGSKSRIGKVISCNDCGGIVSVDGNPPGSERAEEEYSRIGQRIIAGAGASGAASSCGATHANAESNSDALAGIAWLVTIGFVFFAIYIIVKRRMRRRRPRR